MILFEVVDKVSKHADILGEAFALQVLNAYFGGKGFIGASVEIKLAELSSVIYQDVDDLDYYGATITSKRSQKKYVALNTRQSLRLRYFTACHELWHVLNMKDMMNKNIDEERASEQFALALMLPAHMMKLIWYGVKKSEEEKRIIQIADMASAPYVVVAKRLVDLNLKNTKWLTKEKQKEEYWIALRETLGIVPSPLDGPYPYVNFKEYEDVILESVKNNELTLVEASTKLALLSPKTGHMLFDKWIKLGNEDRYDIGDNED